MRLRNLRERALQHSMYRERKKAILNNKSGKDTINFVIYGGKQKNIADFTIFSLLQIYFILTFDPFVTHVIFF